MFEAGLATINLGTDFAFIDLGVTKRYRKVPLNIISNYSEISSGESDDDEEQG